MNSPSHAAVSSMTRTRGPGLDCVSLSRPGLVEHFITAYPVPGQPPFSMFDAIADFAARAGATLLTQDVFGPCRHHRAGMAALRAIHGAVNWPVAWIEGDGYVADAMTGTQAYAVSGAPVERLFLDEQPVGALYEDADARYCLLGNITPPRLAAPRPQQAYATFERMEAALGLVGMDFSHVARTWLYAQKILEWYGDLNKARDRFFRERGVFDGIVPASTGIGVFNPAGAAVVADVFAVKPKTDNVKVVKIASPLQCPALDYKSSFSRAVEVNVPGHTTLFVSGTASLSPDGQTAHPDDLAGQIALTMQVVRAILESRGLDWDDVSRAAAYFKDIRQAPMLDSYFSKTAIPAPPIAIAHADICRDALLFEIELDAIKVAPVASATVPPSPGR